MPLQRGSCSFQIKGALHICRAFAGRCRWYSKGEFKGEFKGRLGKYIDEMGGGGGLACRTKVMKFFSEK